MTQTMPTDHDLIHLGQRCIPSLLINELLNDSNKSVFADLTIGLKDAADLIENNFEDFINNQDLILIDSKSKKSTKITKYLDLYQRLMNYGGGVFHKNYPTLRFRHQFAITGTTIKNYTFVQLYYKQKIHEFQTIMNSRRPALFVHFAWSSEGFEENLDYFFNKVKNKYPSKFFKILVYCSPTDFSESMSSSLNKKYRDTNIYVHQLTVRNMKNWFMKGERYENQNRLLNQDILKGYQNCISTFMTQDSEKKSFDKRSHENNKNLFPETIENIKSTSSLLFTDHNQVKRKRLSTVKL
jgi:hypothetical protein